MISALSAPDPMHFTVPPQLNIIMRTSAGKSRRNPNTVLASGAVAFIVAGQSTCVGTSQGNYVPTNATKCHNLSILDGAIYEAKDPSINMMLVDASVQATMFTRVADLLVANGAFPEVVFASVGVCGTTISQWDVGGLGMPPLYHQILVAKRRFAALGFTSVCTVWDQGPSDTYMGTTQSSYSASLNSLMAKVDAEGPPGKWIMALNTYIPGGIINSGVRAAITASIDNVNIFIGPDLDTLDASKRWDDQHFNAAGNAGGADLYCSAIIDIL